MLKLSVTANTREDGEDKHTYIQLEDDYGELIDRFGRGLIEGVYTSLIITIVKVEDQARG